MKSIPERALVVTDSPVFNGTDVQQILISLNLSLDVVSMLTASGSLSKSALAQGVFNTVVSLSQASGHHSIALLGLLLTALRPGGSLRVQEPKVCD